MSSAFIFVLHTLTFLRLVAHSLTTLTHTTNITTVLQCWLHVNSVHSTATQTWRAPELTERSCKPTACVTVPSQATTEAALERALTVITLTDQRAGLPGWPT